MAQGIQEIKTICDWRDYDEEEKGNFILDLFNIFSTLILKPIHLMNFCMCIAYYKHKKCNI